jgi:hypothetical protein
LVNEAALQSSPRNKTKSPVTHEKYLVKKSSQRTTNQRKATAVTRKENKKRTRYGVATPTKDLEKQITEKELGYKIKLLPSRHARSWNHWFYPPG